MFGLVAPGSVLESRRPPQPGGLLQLMVLGVARSSLTAGAWMGQAKEREHSLPVSRNKQGRPITPPPQPSPLPRGWGDRGHAGRVSHGGQKWWRSNTRAASKGCPPPPLPAFSLRASQGCQACGPLSLTPPSPGPHALPTWLLREAGDSPCCKAGPQPHPRPGHCAHDMHTRTHTQAGLPYKAEVGRAIFIWDISYCYLWYLPS